MVTLAGTQDKFVDALKEVIELDFELIEAYEAAIVRISNAEYKEKFMEFKREHEKRISELGALLNEQGEMMPQGPGMAKQWLAKGKIVLANLIGDSTVLNAMHSNEVDASTAYERMVERKDKWENSEEIFKKGLEDENKHKKWLEAEISFG